jgi:hypothetical protein
MNAARRMRTAMGIERQAYADTKVLADTIVQ